MDEFQVPQQVHARIEQVLEQLPERLSRSPIHYGVRIISSLAACLVLVLLVLMPNVSIAYAKAAQDIPVLGKLIEVFTIRNYWYDDSHYSVNASIPAVNAPQYQQAESLINQDVDQLTQTILQQFYREMEIGQNKGYGSIYIDYETVSNTEDWFTLKLSVSEVSASSNSYFKFYHIDRANGRYVTFGDLFAEEGRQAISQMVLEQMGERMENDSTQVYKIAQQSDGQCVLALKSDQNFYFSPQGDLVVAFDKYDVSPGFMGTPEFTIPYDSIMSYVQYDLKAK